MGLGTERLEEEIKRIFPLSKILRMDADTTTTKGSHNRIIEEFNSGNYNILVGTQMISKGLNFPCVTLVGVINADSSLNIQTIK